MAELNSQAWQVDEPWPLYIMDHAGEEHRVIMKPGQMVFYESVSNATSVISSVIRVVDSVINVMNSCRVFYESVNMFSRNPNTHAHDHACSPPPCTGVWLHVHAHAHVRATGALPARPPDALPWLQVCRFVCPLPAPCKRELSTKRDLVQLLGREETSLEEK